MAVDWIKDGPNGGYRPTLYPGESSDDWEIPKNISPDHAKLNSIIESKYSREYLKICAFYNKMFPSLKASEWSNASYNTQPFTTLDQERSDTGTGINYNYLKQIVDQLTSRLGTITFVPQLFSEEQSYEFIVYKDEVERMLRKYIRDDKFNRMCLEAFHNAAVVGYSHAFIDPYTSEMVKANDYEIGMFESQFNKGKIVQMLYRDYAFPVTEALRYLVDCDDEQQLELTEGLSGKSTVDFKMYFDCTEHNVYVTINNKTLPPHEYPFDYVLVETFQWDTGFSKQLTTSEFDLLYPIQREINRIAAKKQQLMRMYKGPTPVFNTDADLVVKQISNGSGEALFLDSARSTADLMTVINPTPLDPQLDAEIQSAKTSMYELAGISNASFDMENMRSAAAVVALDQTRDSMFQAQLSGHAQFIKDCLKLYIDYFVQYPDKTNDRQTVDWQSIKSLIDRSYINLQPVHINDPASDEEAVSQKPLDYVQLALARVTLSVVKGDVTFSELPYFVIPEEIVLDVGSILVKFEALGIAVPDCVHKFMADAFVYFVKKGEVVLV